MTIITAEYWNHLSRKLEEHHSLFYQCWAMGKPIFTTDVETAAIQFNKDGGYLAFLFNPNFWEMLDDYNRLFVIAHECLHVTLNHGVRTQSIRRDNKAAVNCMLDVVVNHMLVENFGFDRNKIMDWDNLCWVDTVFPKKLQLTTRQSFEYYYNMLPQARSNFGGTQLLDDHGKFGKSGFDKAIERLSQNMTEEDKKTIGSLLGKHSPDGTGKWFTVNALPKPKQKWETVVQQWSRRYMRRDIQSKEQWTRTNRRLAGVDNDLFLPTDCDVDHWKKDRLPVYFFLDTSGSCWNLKDRFFTAALSLPIKRFEVRLFCFDTEVKETTLASKQVYGGGWAPVSSALKPSSRSSSKRKGQLTPRQCGF